VLQKSRAKFDVKGESLNEERNQEKGAREKEGAREEKEVVTARSDQEQVSKLAAPSNRGRFFFGMPRFSFGPHFHWSKRYSNPAILDLNSPYVSVPG
jgi:hypothetical protein